MPHNVMATKEILEIRSTRVVGAEKVSGEKVISREKADTGNTTVVSNSLANVAL